ncbi:MAG TPA: maleylpyruvate isomerase family mycothiol-dependent enzyme [Dehalococcoidia bacterium]|nr:maleylpyruvate isomerase family mycothiol-dependent enzyme [Dehalococcoidia bacterium]
MVAQRIKLTRAPARNCVLQAAEVPELERDEAAAIATVELSRILDLIGSLSTEEWYRPTVNPGWPVRDVVAHLCGLNAIYAHWGEGLRQLLGAWRHRELGLVDAANATQVAARRDWTPAELTAALAADGPRCIRFRHLVPGPLRRLPVVLPIAGVRPASYFWDTLYTRELWMHRLDIARATDREPVVTADHDGRLVALVLRDLAQSLPDGLGRDVTVYFELSGPAGGNWDVGPGDVPDVTIRLDAIDFVWLSAGRTTPAELERANAVEYAGNPALGSRALVLSRVLF